MENERIKFTDRSKEIIEQSQELAKPKLEKAQPKAENDWVIKDRMYYLTGGKAPLSHIIKAADIFYFDEEKGYERELKYTRNQQTPFVDEMKGEHRLDHIIFRDGVLRVEKELYLFLETNRCYKNYYLCITQ